MPETSRPAKSEPRRETSRRPGPLADLSASEAAFEYFTEYSRERPEVVAMWAFGLGFVLGWKLRIF